MATESAKLDRLLLEGEAKTDGLLIEGGIDDQSVGECFFHVCTLGFFDKCN